MDRAVSALLTDLDERGMLDDTLVVLMGEMGRTPIINNLKRGRDHWPDVYSVMMAGGGLTRGQLLGSSDKGGGKPGTRPVHVHEILATVYQQLGIDPHTMLRNPQNRPIRILPDAEPVYELTRS
jgi:arylsulfatase A-like enzyme